MSTPIKVLLNQPTLRRLAEIAVAERRPLDLMAEVLIMRQLGCWPEDHVENEALRRRGSEVEETARVG
jgi:hypothetical protein